MGLHIFAGLYFKTPQAEVGILIFSQSWDRLAYTPDESFPLGMPKHPVHQVLKLEPVSASPGRLDGIQFAEFPLEFLLRRSRVGPENLHF